MKRIVIVGGGVVGGLMAQQLAEQGRHAVTVLDAADQQAQDPRTLALAHTTQQMLAQCGLWQGHAQRQAAPIAHIHVSERGGAGSSEIHAQRYQLPALGYVVPAQAIVDDLTQALATQDQVELRHGAQVADLHYQAEGVDVQLADGSKLAADMVIAADGGRSVVREQLGIARMQSDYGQTALIANVELDRSHQGRAFERFTEHGPIALLPRADGQGSRHMALVWCVPNDDAEAMRTLQDEDFLSALQSAFGYRAGQFMSLRDRASYPLYLLLAERCVYHRTVILGNACHTLHPIAGQGYNLGARDVADLSRVFAASADELPSYTQLLDYQQQRQLDYKRIVTMTDGLVRLFSNQYPPLVAGRNLGLMALRMCPPLTLPLARMAMGYRSLAGA